MMYLMGKVYAGVNAKILKAFGFELVGDSYFNKILVEKLHFS